MIIGPYKENGEIWGCDRDACNGAFVDGSYVYVGSDNFPYVVGCWGPGPDPLYEPTCSTSGCGSPASTAGEDEDDDSDTVEVSAMQHFALSLGIATTAASTLLF